LSNQKFGFILLEHDIKQTLAKLKANTFTIPAIGRNNIKVTASIGERSMNEPLTVA